MSDEGLLLKVGGTEHLVCVRADANDKKPRLCRVIYTSEDGEIMRVGAGYNDTAKTCKRGVFCFRENLPEPLLNLVNGMRMGPQAPRDFYLDLGGTEQELKAELHDLFGYRQA